MSAGTYQGGRLVLQNDTFSLVVGVVRWGKSNITTIMAAD